MVWYTMAGPNGEGWAFDPDGAAHVIRSNHYNRQLVLRSRIVRRDHGFLMPTTTEVETNFNGIRDEVTRQARVTVDQLDRDFNTNPRRLYEWLVHVREDGESAGDSWRTMSQQATRESAQAINANVDGWENALAATRFVRDASAGILFVGATVLSGGAAAAAMAGGAGLTFTGNTQDNLASNQTLRQAMGNAAIATTIAVVTNVLIPRGLSAFGRGMMTAGQTTLTMDQNVALGLISVQANFAGDVIKTALTADSSSMSETAARQFRRQMAGRAGFEITAMLFQSWLASRGIPASAFLRRSEDVVNSATGGTLSAIGDRVVAAIQNQDTQARGPGVRPRDLDIAFTRLRRTMDAEAYVREVAMRPA